MSKFKPFYKTNATKTHYITMKEIQKSSTQQQNQFDENDVMLKYHHKHYIDIYHLQLNFVHQQNGCHKIKFDQKIFSVQDYE